MSNEDGDGGLMFGEGVAHDRRLGQIFIKKIASEAALIIEF